LGVQENTWRGTWPNFCSNANTHIIWNALTLSSLRSANSIPLLPSSLVRPSFVFSVNLRTFILRRFDILLSLLIHGSCFCLFSLLLSVLRCCLLFLFLLTSGLRDTAPSNRNITGSNSRGSSSIKVCHCISYYYGMTAYNQHDRHCFACL